MVRPVKETCATVIVPLVDPLTLAVVLVTPKVCKA